MKKRFLKVFWIVLLVLSSFTLGYTLKPTSSKRTMPSFMSQQLKGRPMPMGMPSGRQAPPLNFRRQ